LAERRLTRNVTTATGEDGKVDQLSSEHANPRSRNPEGGFILPISIALDLFRNSAPDLLWASGELPTFTETQIGAKGRKTFDPVWTCPVVLN
jgi:hypothetical protein